MKLAPRRRLTLIGVSLALLALGAGVASQVSDALGLQSQPSVGIPVENLTVAPASAVVLPPEFTAIDAPDDLRVSTAVDELRDAVADAGTTSGTATLTVTFDSVEASGEGYSVSGTPTDIRITAASRSGAVLGVYDLAAAVRAGRPVTENLGRTVESKLPFRMVDLGAVGVEPDADAYAAGTDYSHNSNAFKDVILADAPYIDDAALARATIDFEEYVRHTLALGYNAIAVPGFIEYVTFEGVGDGTEVYAADDPHRARAEAMRAAFGPMLDYAHELGMKVYFRTDMLALTTPLQEYFERTFGGLATDDPAFWDVYRAGLDELYAAMPSADGVVVRIGEAGRVYDLPGWDYYSELAVTSVASVRAMLTTFSDQAEASGREVIFRSWSVGVGAVGDMHTDPESNAEVLDGIDSPALVVSTKYSLGDFYSYLPLNTTLDSGSQRRIVEFQSRREFEDYGALPNDLGVLYQQALAHFIAANPNVEGIWTWTQDGGPWRAGPLTLELKAGFWQLYELNTRLTVDLARNPDADPAELTADWIRQYFSDDPATVQAIGAAMADSRAAVTGGLYIGPFASQRVRALGLEPPPMMWIFEWDILTGDSAVLDVIYHVSKPELEQAIAEGEAAVETATSMRDAIAATDADAWRDDTLREHFVDTLDYQVNLFQTLGSYRTMVLRHAQWLDTGSDAAYSDWAQAKTAFQGFAAVHEANYAGDLDLPAYNLTAARIGMERATLDLPMAWLARVILVLLALWLALGILAGRAPFSRWPGAAAARALWLAGTRPWRATDAVAGLSRLSKVLLVVVPAALLVVSRGILTWFIAPTHLLFTLAAWLVFAAGIAVVMRKSSPWPVIAAAGGAIALRVVLLLAVLAVRGPGYYWFGFWTDPTARTLYITVAFALFAWVLVAVGWSLAGQIGGRRATGAVLGASGLVLVLLGGFLGVVGLEQALTVWNDQMALLPWGLSRILGLTVYLEIPASTPWYAAAFGALLLVVGALLALRWRRSAVDSSPA
ncbi:hypothetical protein [Orlajensenia leifsoniae]|uniref:Glycosyl hydrolase family 67 C-terminal domain-containing protein n=1 Tax=Orlajensenia leifsoniae TaxID=2561933 RepID=A0A4Y9R077_9MICO|nr:hypothetical protein [Leifsonia flava]TFV96786.1 hypothetical protein E4M00_11980 [Leifsonia flava]